MSKSIRRPWSIEEDTILLQLIDKYGANGCWPKISLQMESRTGKQCRERYINHLDPNMKTCAWSQEEDNIIRDLFPSLGTKWSRYMTALVGRSDNAIKNRYHVISRNFDSRSVASATVPSSNYLFSCHKRSADEITSTESDLEGEEESSLNAKSIESRKRLKNLRAARVQLDRQILALEAQQRASADTLSSHPSPHSDLSTTFGEDELLSELEDFDFNWAGCDGAGYMSMVPLTQLPPTPRQPEAVDLFDAPAF